jgi:prepilin-type N-terminal cleavage/methylation domain-containing protein
MNSRKIEHREKRQQASGFSLTELVVAMAVALVLMGIGMPYFLKAYHAYQLTNAAEQLSDILRLTRYEAIRLNKGVNCVIKPVAADPTMTNAFADDDGDTNPGPTEKIVLLGNGGNLVDSGGVAGTGGLLAGANVTSGTIVVGPGNTSVKFDSRGAVMVGGAITNSVYVFYLASPIAPEAGFRAVLLMPSGSIQIWTGDVSGNWGQLR